MSQVQRGGEGSGGKPGAPRKAAPAKRPAAATATKGRQPGAGSGRPPGGGAKGRPPSAGGAKGRAPRQNMKITAPPPRRFSPSTLAFVSIAVVVVIVLVFVVVKVTGSNTPTTSATAIPPPSPASPAVVAKVTGVTPAEMDAIGLGQGVTAPSVLKNQPNLTSNGKPELLYIGAEFCPYCAAERWSMVLALSRFGTWSGLKESTSSLWDAFPSTATFSFRDATLTSQYISFVSVENQTNDNNGQGSRKPLQRLTTAQGNLWTKYSTQFGTTTGYPFISFGNKVFVLGPSYVPDVLAGLNQSDIAAKLSNPNDVVTQRIVGTANYLTAAICALTGNNPSSVCSASGVHKAAVALKLS
jgi:hypothetical protein